MVLGITLLVAAGPTATGARHVHDPSMAAHEIQVPAAAYVPLASPVSRSLWTVSASDQETSAENDPASAAIDGDPATFWHSQYFATADPTPFPHSITIDMHAATVVSALTYLPRPSSSPNGRIGQFSVSLSSDGVTWGAPVATGTWADDATTKTASFAQQSTRFVRLTATSEAGNRGPWSSAAELNLLGKSSTAASVQYVTVARTGWTATASDEETTSENAPASNAIDGDPATFWHSQYTGTPLPLPHSITLDMKQAIPVAGLRYLPRPGGGNGTIGGYTIAVSTDGTTFTDVTSGTWADGQSEKLATFPTTTARYVRLTATTEAGNRGPWSSAAEINIVQQTTAAPTLGSWGPVINFPIVPVSAVLLPGNRVLTFSAVSPTGFTSNGSTTPNGDSSTQVSILDLGTGAVSQRVISNTGHQMFCPGLALLPDGRLLVNGGSDSGATSIYSPSTDTWTAGPQMNIPRGYEGDTTLSNGQVFTLGGSWNGGQGGKDGEVFTPDGSWRRLPNVTASSILTNDAQGVYRADNHGWFFAVSDGGVFHAGPSKQMNWFTTDGDGTQTSAGLRGTSGDAMNGNAVMYDTGKILTLGGSPSYQDSNATNAAYAIDISRGPGQPVTTTQVGSMSAARAFSNSVVLPDGSVLVIGGQPYPVPFTDSDAVLVPELWNPSTSQFTRLAPMAEPRTYHSVALLLPDGRVFSGGGGLCGACATNHSDGQIFTPPYLLRSNGTLKPRPSISRAPATAVHGTTIAVKATSGLTKFALVRTGATTHSVDSDQRRVPLQVVSASGTSYQLAIPADTGVVVPGYYLLFAINAAGTPSVAAQVRIS